MPGKHLTPFERTALETYLACGLSQAAIAREMGRSESTICREIRRSSKASGRYSAVDAQRRYKTVRAKCRPRKKLSNPALRERVDEGLREEWSPEQISHRRKVSLDTAIRLQIWTHSNPDGEEPNQ